MKSRLKRPTRHTNGAKAMIPCCHGVIYTITDIADDKVVLDGNHPLAGTALDFSCTVKSVRAATDEEIDHGHVHDPDGDAVHIAH